MKFIHCSDLHLDSSMESNLSFQQAQERNAEILTTFARMAAYAQEHQIPVIAIAGDLFDTDRVSGRTADFVLHQIRSHPDIDFLYLKGNHDESRRAFAGRELPENLKTFRDSWTSYRYGSVVFTGAELTKENALTVYDSLALDPGDTNIVLLHGQVSTQAGEDLVCLPKLRGRNIHYLALGHLHSYQKQALDLNADWCYCGCLEGRGFDECGEKGFVVGETQGQRVTTQFIPFAKRTLWDVPVDISGLLTVVELQSAMEKAAEGIPSQDLLKFTLRGTCFLDTQKDLTFLRNTLSPNFYFVKIKDESVLAIPKESYEHDISLKGEFVRLVMASDLSQEDRDNIICAGIQALSGEAITL